MENPKKLLEVQKYYFSKLNFQIKVAQFVKQKFQFVIKPTSLLPCLMFEKAHLLFWVVASRLSFYKMAAVHYETSTSGSLNLFKVCTVKEHAMLDLPEAMLLRLIVCSGSRALGDLSTHYPIIVF